MKWFHGSFSEYLRGHNGFNETARIRAVEVRNEKCLAGEISSWNAGLTKETDERVAASALKIGAGVLAADMSARLASRSDDEKAVHYANISKAKIGCQSWNKGLTKETHPSLIIVSDKLARATHDRFSWQDKPERISEFVSSNSSELELINSEGYETKYTQILLRCKLCGTNVKRSLHVLRYANQCPVCHKSNSKPQCEIYERVLKMFPDAVMSDTSTLSDSKLELDILVPSRGFAVEYNGLFYHSVARRPNHEYHQTKSDACRDNGINLLHVYGDDWEFRSEIIMSMIAHRLGLSKRVHGRACTVVELTAKERRSFFDANHLDGDTQSRTKVAFGLKHDSELIAAISMRDPFHKKWVGHIEIARFANKLGHNVSGGLSKLVAVASTWARQKGYTNMMTYADGRVGTGNGYDKSGFNFAGRTAPMFWWTDDKVRYNRFKFRADKKRGLTEKQVAELAGVRRIYGCTNTVYTKVL